MTVSPLITIGYLAVLDVSANGSANETGEEHRAH